MSDEEINWNKMVLDMAQSSKGMWVERFVYEASSETGLHESTVWEILIDAAWGDKFYISEGKINEVWDY